jgi:hypothetical protein
MVRSQNMYSCNYNGWADVPEEEREGIDTFEATRRPTTALVPASLSAALIAPALAASRHTPGLSVPQRKAA